MRSESWEGIQLVLAARQSPQPLAMQAAPTTQAAPAPPSGQHPKCHSLATCHPCVLKRTWELALPRRSRAGKHRLLALPQGTCKMLEKLLAGELGGTRVDVALSPCLEHHALVTRLFARLGPTVSGKPRQGSAEGNCPVPLQSVAVRLMRSFDLFVCLPLLWFN